MSSKQDFIADQSALFDWIIGAEKLTFFIRKFNKNVNLDGSNDFLKIYQSLNHAKNAVLQERPTCELIFFVKLLTYSKLIQFTE